MQERSDTMQLTKNNWNKTNYNEFINYLHSLQDLKYKEFHSKLLNNQINLIGIKTPILRNIAKDISKGNYIEFLNLNQHKYYEENIIHGFIISNLKLPINEIINHINNYLQFIDNWATCDLICSSLKIISKNKDVFLKYINKLIIKDNEWTRRFCFVILLDYYIESPYLEKIFYLCDNYNNDKYYVNMAIAWLISICYIKHKEQTIIYLNNNKLDKFTHNKAIQKIIESNRISKEEKNKIKLLKR